MSNETVGSLLADIANSIISGLNVLNTTDKSQWGPDEHEQRRRLSKALDEAKADFQELSNLVHGQRYYMNDRTFDSLNDLRTLKSSFENLADNLHDWANKGGPINPIWSVETTDLRINLHRAQCRAARRIFISEQELVYPRCLGAYLVYRKQRAWAARQAKKRHQRMLEELRQQAAQTGTFDSDIEAAAHAAGTTSPNPPSTPTQPYRHRRQGSSLVPSDDTAADDAADDEYERHKHLMEELATCNEVGKFERFGDHDIAFVCDYCDGHIVWQDLETMPSLRTADEETVAASATAEPEEPQAGGASQEEGQEGDSSSGPAGAPPAEPRMATTTAAADVDGAAAAAGITNWQATGFTSTKHREKSVVFAPLAIANHVPPTHPGDWEARLRCATCDEPPPDYTPPEGEEEDEGGGWTVNQDLVFDDLAGLQEHLEWQHTAYAMPSMPVGAATGGANCVVM